MNTLLKNLFCKAGFVEVMPNRVDITPWICSMGERIETLTLHSWSAASGFKPVDLPKQRQQTDASSHSCDLVEYWNREFAKTLKPGWYILQHRFIPGDWEKSWPKKTVTYVFYIG